MKFICKTFSQMSVTLRAESKGGLNGTFMVVSMSINYLAN
jgi:hypothetical protein